MEYFGKEPVTELNRVIGHLHSYKYMLLKFGPLEKSSLHLRVYTDSSFMTNYDHSSQIGYVILLCNSQDWFHILDFARKLRERVVRSSTAVETYVLIYGFDALYATKITLERVHREKNPTINSYGL